MKDDYSVKNEKQEVREQEMTEKLNVYHEEMYFQNKELLRTQQALEKSKDSYKELFNNAPAGYIIYSNTNKLIKVNKAFSKMIGVSQRKILGTLITDYINHSDQDKFYFHKKKLLKEKKSHSIKIKIHQLEVIAITNLIEFEDEIHFKTIFIGLPKKD